MSYPLVIRLVIAMTLLPGSSYAEAVRTLAGLLADIPFTLDWHVPTGKTVSGMAAADPGGDHGGDLLARRRAADRRRGAVGGDAGRDARRTPRTGCWSTWPRARRTGTYFGTTGTGDGTSPFAQLRVVALTARAGRAILAAALGKASDGEQTLLKRPGGTAAGGVRGTASPASTGTSPAMT